MLAVQTAVSKFVRGENIGYEIAKRAALEIMEGKASDILISGLLVGWGVKGETTEEIVGVSEALFEKAIQLDLGNVKLLDTCGTGGDGSKTFNISTAAAFVCAACGINVAKHGNRSQSSVSGSADVLEELGAKVDLCPKEAKKVLEKTGITFLFAPVFHPAMRFLSPVRKELKIRTIFNFVGPIVNPARAQYRLLGVSSKDHLKKVAEALAALGVEKAFVYHSENGLDEIALDSDIHVIEVTRQNIREFVLNHKDFGLKKVDHKEVVVSSPKESARAILSVFSDEKTPFYDYVVASAAAGIYVYGASKTLRGAVEMAKTAISSGKALETLRNFVEETGGKLIVS